MESNHKNIENIDSLELVSYAMGDDPESRNFAELIRSELKVTLKIFTSVADALNLGDLTATDIFLVDEKIAGDKDAGIKICHQLRRNGFSGIIILCVANENYDEISHSIVTSLGFDNFLPRNCSEKTLFNQIHWAILNRRRKIKNLLQFDNNPDALFTLDKSGNVLDINDTATIGSDYSPREIVTKNIHIRDIGTLPTFDEHIKHLIINENVGRVFEHTSDERGVIHQVKVRIADIAVVGLVATVFKTDISTVTYERTLDILTNSITLLGQRDYYTAGHSSRVFYYCQSIMEQMGLTSDKKFTRDIYCAALLHDIGKIGVKDQILLKPGKLTDSEFSELASHSVKGYKILKQFSFLEESVQYVKHHHERPDGKGYPDKLIGNSIPLGAAIISVADSFDAMTTNRPYRNSLDFDRALGELKTYDGSQFNSDVIQAFLSILSTGLMQKVAESTKKSLAAITSEMLNLLKGNK